LNASEKTEDRRIGQRGKGRPFLLFWTMASGLAWLLHLLLAYAIAEWGCIRGSRVIAGISGTAWLLLALSFLLLAASAAATFIPWRHLRRMEAAGGESDTQRGAEEHLARMGFLAGVGFTLVILIESIPIFFYLQECG
jgi:hypothetical protein